MQRADEEITRILRLPLESRIASYNSHKVNVRGEKYWAYDAKELNRDHNQKKRGEYRYLVRGNDFEIGIHSRKGYRIVKIRS